ncbi:hypothetical protein BOG92_001085 [Streptomyces sp. WAC00263]|nr:hypothetical protein BOG92_001085 [Streptomyces sp. WAC00263]
MAGTTKETQVRVADGPEAGNRPARTEAPVQGLPPGEVFGALGGSPRGLAAEAVRAGQERYGPNELPRPRGKGLWRRFLAQFTDLFAVVLLIASGLTFLAYGLLISGCPLGNRMKRTVLCSVIPVARSRRIARSCRPRAMRSRSSYRAICSASRRRSVRVLGAEPARGAHGASFLSSLAVVEAESVSPAPPEPSAQAPHHPTVTPATSRSAHPANDHSHQQDERHTTARITSFPTESFTRGRSHVVLRRHCGPTRAHSLPHWS